MKTKLSEKYRPRTLDDVVGQPGVASLKQLVRDPYPCCIMIEGPPGTGKTSTALSLAADLGCVDPWSGLEVIVSTELTIERCRQLFERELRLRPMAGNGWRVVVVEEMEACTSQQVCRYLKKELDPPPERVIVVATTNAAGAIEEALLQRFELFFFASSPEFVDEGVGRLRTIWERETGGEDFPVGVIAEGYDRKGVFSLRKAIGALQQLIEVRCPVFL